MDAMRQRARVLIAEALFCLLHSVHVQSIAALHKITRNRCRVFVVCSVVLALLNREDLQWIAKTQAH